LHVVLVGAPFIASFGAWAADPPEKVCGVDAHRVVAHRITLCGTSVVERDLDEDGGWALQLLAVPAEG
jgi:hypothetical protein